MKNVQTDKESKLNKRITRKETINIAEHDSKFTHKKKYLRTYIADSLNRLENVRDWIKKAYRATHWM